MSSLVAGPSTVAPSSDDDITMLDSTSAPLPPSTNTIDVDTEASDGNEEEYEIESIVSHSDSTIDGQLSYFVKWKGYPDTENSWVFESDMGGAQEMIQEYWAKVPKKGVKRMGNKRGKKGKRQSSVGVGSSSTPSKTATGGARRKRTRRESSLVNGGDAPKRTRKGAELSHSRSPTPDDALIDVESDPALQRIRSDLTLTNDQRQLLEQQHLHAIKLDRLRKRYARIPDWDPIIKKIEAVERMSDNKLRVFVHFESGDRLAFESVVAHHRCPLKLLAFYEANLRFKRNEEGGMGGRVEMLRGEEELGELEEYNRVLAAAEVEGEGEGEGLNRGAVGEGEGVETQITAQEKVEKVAEEGEGEGEGVVAAVAVAVTENADGDAAEEAGEGEGDAAATTITTAIANGEERVSETQTSAITADNIPEESS
ncbi:uncharacterized protein UDID_07750 [Ustilago sp. UG-2017a]|nr:uncharacterized protein UDID_07750 [Ustilago sp. UG-2017a]